MYTCRICGNSAGNTVYVAKEMMLGLRDSFVYFQCMTCECLQLANVPTDTSRYYPPSYYSLRHVEEPPPRTGLRRWAQRHRDRYAILDRGLFGRLLYAMSPNEPFRHAARQHFPGQGTALGKLSPSSRILDVGCGSGAFLLMLHTAGFRHVQGIDLYLDTDIAYPGGLRILKCSFADCTGQWDVVMFHHSFEHLPDPLGALKHAARLLRVGGTVVVRIPLVTSYAWERYRVNWVQLDAPRHVFLHSRASMARLAHGAQFNIEAIVYDSTEFQFVGSELYEQNIALSSFRANASNPGGSSFSPEQIERFRRQAADLNATERGDQAAFYLRRI